ncbi:MAG: NAD(P)-dependent oxidoreductase [Eggerthellaceae bacterium]|nr:NAD(P)-dependent oxidoreductase [Eggerthellaceae bacterium]
MTTGYAYRGSERLIGAVAERLAEAGFAPVEEEAAADVVITFCTSQRELEDLYFGEGGFVQSLAPGALLVDLSATTPGFARELNAVATVSDLVMVEAPLVVDDLARVDTFARDNASCFAAGEGDGVARALPLLEALFGVVHQVGSPGAAQLARAAYTMQVAAQVVAAIEADALYRAVRRSPAGSGLGDLRPGALSAAGAAVLEAVDAGRFEGAYTVEMLMAELSAALMAADDAELILPQAEAAMHLLELLAVIGGSDKAPAALSLVYGEEAECAAHGLDWTRAEQAYAQQPGDDDGWDAVAEEDDDDWGSDWEDGFDYRSN